MSSSCHSAEEGALRDNSERTSEDLCFFGKGKKLALPANETRMKNRSLKIVILS
jgi:hypothetical protein